MAFDTFDEGISLGGVRSKTEIRTLICYMFDKVNTPMKKETVISALQQKGLANYFESSSCFDDLLSHKNLVVADEEKQLYTLTDAGKMIAKQLEDTLALTVKEKALECTLYLLEKERVEKENVVTIEKIDNGYNVHCSISGGDMELMKFSIYVPDINLARIVRKNFHKKPQLMYNVMIAMLTKNKGLVEDALSDLNSRL